MGRGRLGDLEESERNGWHQLGLVVVVPSRGMLTWSSRHGRDKVGRDEVGIQRLEEGARIYRPVHEPSQNRLSVSSEPPSRIRELTAAVMYSPLFRELYC